MGIFSVLVMGHGMRGVRDSSEENYCRFGPSHKLLILCCSNAIVSSCDFITHVLSCKGDLINNKKPKHHKAFSFEENFHFDIIFNKLLTVITEGTVFAISCQRHGRVQGEHIYLCTKLASKDFPGGQREFWERPTLMCFPIPMLLCETF